MTILPNKDGRGNEQPTQREQQTASTRRSKETQRSQNHSLHLLPLGAQKHSHRASLNQPSEAQPQQRDRLKRKINRDVVHKHPAKLANTSGGVQQSAGTSVGSDTNEDETGMGGYNSEDEYENQCIPKVSAEEWIRRDTLFKEMMLKKGFIVKEIEEDGACLFRAISDQIYGNEDMHSVVRKLCMDYIQQNRDYFSQYICEDIQSYINRKRMDSSHGNHLEIQALSEMYGRPIEVYCYEDRPTHTFNKYIAHNNAPFRLAYLRNSHYNSIVDPHQATIGVGLGLPNYNPGEADSNLLNDVAKQSELSAIEQTMIQDKIAASDWEATNDALIEQAARESLAQYVNHEYRTKNEQAGSSSQHRFHPSSSATQSSSASNQPSSYGNLLNRSFVSSPRLNSSRVPTPTNKIQSTAQARNRCLQSSTQSSSGSGSSSSCCSSQSLPSSPRGENQSPKHCLSMPSSPKSPPHIYHPNLMNIDHRKSPIVHEPPLNELDSERKMVDERVAKNNNNNDSTDADTNNILDYIGPDILGMDDWREDESALLARVLAESQQEYLDNLKSQLPNNPGPSSSKAYQ